MAIDFHSRANRGAYASRHADDGWKTAIRRIAEPSGKRVADIGCGGGIYSQAWRELGARTVTGVDFSQAMVDAAREQAAGLSDISFRQGDAVATGLPPASADIVFERALIHHLKDYGPCFAEARRVLAPGGTLIVQDRTPDDVQLPGSAEHLRGYFFECFPRLLAVETGRRPTDTAVRSALDAAGFAKVEMSVLCEVRKAHESWQELKQDLANRSGRSILHDLSDKELAELLNVSPSAVNRQILKLEAEYGAELFERLPRGLRLTDAGRILVADIERWQHDHARTLQGLAELRSPVRGHAAIGLMESFGRAVVSRLMTHMAERHFQVSLDVFIGGTEQIVEQLAARKLDLAICYAVPRQPDIQFLARVPSNPGIVVARGHPLANRKSIRLADCAKHSFVLPDASLTSRGILEKALRRAGLHPAAMVTTNSIEVMKALVREHRQIALLALPDIHSDLVDGEFVHIPFADRHVRGSSLSLIAHRHVRLSPAAAMVADQLKDQLQQLPGK